MAPKKKADAQPTQSGATQKRTTRRKGAKAAERTKNLRVRAFLMSIVDGMSTREIGAVLDIDHHTAAKYIREESARRAKSLDATREQMVAEAVAFYDEASSLGIELARKSTDAYMQPLVKGLDAAIKARERKDKILGLDAPVKVDMGLQELVNAINAERPG